jgi:hypothetical protein
MIRLAVGYRSRSQPPVVRAFLDLARRSR